MNAAIVVLWLSVLGLGVACGCFILFLGWKALEALVAFIQHELMMRPRERYYRM